MRVSLSYQIAARQPPAAAAAECAREGEEGVIIQPISRQKDSNIEAAAAARTERGGKNREGELTMVSLGASGWEFRNVATSRTDQMSSAATARDAAPGQTRPRREGRQSTSRARRPPFISSSAPHSSLPPSLPSSHKYIISRGATLPLRNSPKPI